MFSNDVIPTIFGVVLSDNITLLLLFVLLIIILFVVALGDFCVVNGTYEVAGGLRLLIGSRLLNGSFVVVGLYRFDDGKCGITFWSMLFSMISCSRIAASSCRREKEKKKLVFIIEI